MEVDMATTSERADRIRIALRHLLDRDALQDGDLTKLALHFGCSRERVRQLKDEVLRDMRSERIAALRPDISRVREAMA